MSCIKLRVSTPAKRPGVLAEQAAKMTRPGHDSGRDATAPRVGRTQQLLRRLLGHRFHAGDVPTPLPPTAPPPVPGGIPDIGGDAPDAISYPRTAEDGGGSWCGCCCPGEAPEVDPALRNRRRARA